MAGGAYTNRPRLCPGVEGKTTFLVSTRAPIWFGLHDSHTCVLPRLSYLGLANMTDLDWESVARHLAPLTRLIALSESRGSDGP